MTRKLATPAADAKVEQAPTPRVCACGCGIETIRPEATYRSGHDARHAGQVAKAVIAGQPVETIDETFKAQPNLARKAHAIVEVAKRKAVEKAAKAAAKEAAKVAYEAALAAK